MPFQPDARNLVAAARNQRSERLPFYEHSVGAEMMGAFLGRAVGQLNKGASDRQRAEVVRDACAFFPAAGYDCVSWECCVTTILPDHGAILGGRPGPIQDRVDFERYPWAELPRRFWAKAEPEIASLKQHLVDGSGIVGGVGNGPFEIVSDLVGFEYLCLMLADDSELVGDIFARVGDLLVELWDGILRELDTRLAVARIGDDLGFKTGTMLDPTSIRRWVVPGYRRVVERVHAAGKPFLLHSCGCIFDVMDDLLAAGIDAKHSNEDAIAPFDRWRQAYGNRLGLFGGVDVDRICQEAPSDIEAWVYEHGQRWRTEGRGWALGSGNSIPGYVPEDGYRAMLSAGERLRSLVS